MGRVASAGVAARILEVCRVLKAKRGFFDKAKRQIKVRGTVMRGVTKAMSQKFGKEEKSRNSVGTVPRGRSGLSFGKMIHVHFERLVRNNGSAGKAGRKVNPLARAAYDAILRDLRMQPLYAEYTVGCERTRVGTRVDVVCISPDTGRLGVVELKTGYGSPADYSSPVAGARRISRAPLILPSPLNRHCVQLALTALLFKRSTGLEISRDCAAIVRVFGASSVDIHRVPAVIWDASDKMLTRIARARPRV